MKHLKRYDDMRMKKPDHFTLIELLIVIVVIMILIALLLPALNRAKYHAKLAVCISNLRQVGTAFTLMAADNDGNYYKRTDWEIGSSRNYIPYLKSVYGSNNFDDRPAYKPYIAEELWHCPLSGPVAGPKADTGPFSLYGATTETVRASYYILAGMTPTKKNISDMEKKKARLTRPGDTMTFKGDSYNIVAGDYFYGQDYGTRWAMSSHPDSFGHLQNRINSTIVTSPTHYQKGSLSKGHPEIGTLELNFVRTDGSAFTVWRTTSRDPAMGLLPVKPGFDKATQDNFAVLPKME